MKKQLTIAILSALACSSAYASWGKVTATFDTLTDTIADGAKDAWDSTKEFSQQAWQDLSQWSSDAIDTIGEWTDASVEQSKEWLSAAETKIDELIQGDTPEEARQAIDLMAETALVKLFNQDASAKTLYDKAYGYAVFDSRKFSLMFHTNSGSGVAVERQTDKRTYMRMFGLGASLGIGGKFYQQVVLFDSKSDFDNFVEKGWEAAGEASVVAGDEGEELSAHFNGGVAIYQLDPKGLLIDANISGSKYWVNEELTNSQ
ncbi:hypothetical protein BIY21_03025 [Vibrio ponticus]|uniref:Lipoprotein n=1 Tax=Vibrio ponticus TaxID=265668 RepID=A0ABX3FBL6_9VIBR|nr:hypothetical protein [Vibrio ponticus]OLQ89092.1 hypothetical protein BIY21_03025 [Vibrio ponticus]